MIDLRWLSDIDYPALVNEMNLCKKILIIDECRKIGCHGEGIFYELSKKMTTKVKIKLHAAKNSYISLGVAATATLPSRESISKKGIEFINE